jgi:hypothetical protein
MSQSPCGSFDENIFFVGEVPESIRAPSCSPSLDDAHSDCEGIEMSCQDANPTPGQRPSPKHEEHKIDFLPSSLLPSPSSPSSLPLLSTSQPAFPPRGALPSLHNPASSSPYHISSPPLQEHPTISEINRRVPYPGLPSSLDPNQARGKILVPSSDTSGSVSQGISQEQKSPVSSQRIPHSQPLFENIFFGEMHNSHPAERNGTGRISDRLSSTSSTNKDKNLHPTSPQEIPLLPSRANDERSSDISVPEGDGTRLEDKMDGDEYRQRHRREASASIVQDSEDDMLDDDDAEILSMLNGKAYHQPSFSANVASTTDGIGRNTKDISKGSKGSPNDIPHPKTKLLEPRPTKTEENTKGSFAQAEHSRQNSVPPKHPMPPVFDSSLPSADTDSVPKRMRGSIQEQNRNDDHDAVAWSAPSFLQAKGKGKAVPTTYKHARSEGTSRASSPVPRKRLKSSETLEQISSTSRKTSQHLSRASSRSHNHHCDRPDRSSHRPRSGSDQQDRRSPPPAANAPPHDSPKMKRSRNSASSSHGSIDSGGLIGQGPTKRRKLTEAVTRSSWQSQGGPRKEGDATTSKHQLPPAKKLKGFTVNFDSILVDTKKGPNLGWEQFQTILLKTGKLRRNEALKQ